MYCIQYIMMIYYYRKEKEAYKMKRRKIKISGMWLTVKDLKELTELLETQETTDKEQKGKYSYISGSDIYTYKIDDEFDVILEEIRR